MLRTCSPQTMSVKIARARNSVQQPRSMAMQVVVLM